ncbi:hypothetical protein [Deinococcus cellulosilyticus]|uniref:Uncharacterized protein n=1 Tax=Deinococcus cellulosilyticus (strain DSM 18568 / NBRC 106333 / KACC 11606 / 5516J-15) TaxID=1223518 RepID=A0A511N1P0_DEIC1|nr:hypothetical protein [Deinococcus cellulosilyticus]GEM46739.1 hypothetical protein DC3_23740 [Deinococcus cellulosilyticus NBRC 106333 = KACC 11606]
MSQLLTLIDETTTGKKTTVCTLTFPETHVTAREILRRRIYAEVTEHNNQSSRSFQGLVWPGGDPAQCTAGHATPPLDWEKQFKTAQQAFQMFQFIMLVQDRQIENLEEEIHLKPDETLEIHFLKLVPLVGG